MWVHRLLLTGMVLGLLALFWAMRMLRRAWDRAAYVEMEQRIAALQLRASLDSLSQGIAVFGPDHYLSNWNDCFRMLPALLWKIVLKFMVERCVAVRTSAG